MAEELPITFRASPLPDDFSGRPQDLLDAIVERLRADTQDSLALFASGSTEPTSDVGPWAKDGTVWRFWNESDGEYQPQVLEQESLRYIVTDSTPDHNNYDVWIKTNVAGKALGVYKYYSGAWVDAYEDKFAEYSTTTQMNTAISTAFKFYPANIRMGGSQAIDIDGAGHKVLYDTEMFDPDSAFDTGTNKYICPVDGIYRVDAHVQVDNSLTVPGDASNMELGFRVGLNGNTTAQEIYSGTSVASPPGSRWYLVMSGLTRANANDSIEVFINAGDGTNTGQVTLANGNFCIQLVQRT